MTVNDAGKRIAQLIAQGFGDAEIVLDHPDLEPLVDALTPGRIDGIAKIYVQCTERPSDLWAKP